MRNLLTLLLSLFFIFLCAGCQLEADKSPQKEVKTGEDLPVSPQERLADWSRAEVRSVGSIKPRHTIHSYFNTSPESPNGKYVLYFSSTDRRGRVGDLYVLERATSREILLASGVVTEDAHRAAAQQWVNNGNTVVYHDFRDGQWIVVAVDVETLDSRVIAKDRQVGFSSPTKSLVPVYGPHWNPGPHRNLELIDLKTGQRRTVVTAEEVVQEYADWVQETFGTNDLSIFFPVISPNGKRVFFKMAHPSGNNNFRSSQASDRHGMVVYDIENSRFIRLFKEWGHPSWYPSSNQIFQKGNVLFNLETNRSHKYCPNAISDHPSLSNDGTLFVTDGDYSRRPTGKSNEWAIVVGSLLEDRSVIVDRFLNNGGAQSWRQNHPHPVFSATDKRLYYNINQGQWTRLMVAEIDSRP